MTTQIQCAHCKGSGTCTSSANESSCAVCMKKHKLLSRANVGELFTGLVCSVCSGQGQVEPFTTRLQQRIVPSLALILVYFALALIWSFASKENFHELLAFAGTLIGSVTGFYFGGRSERARSSKKDGAA